MNKRTIILLATGILSIAVTMLGSRVWIEKSRPQTDQEWRAERTAKAYAEWKTQTRQDIIEGIASAKTDKERKIFEYELRMFDGVMKSGEAASLVDIRDGVDEFEALILAREYFSWQFGLCGLVDLPKKEAAGWVVVITSGREERAAANHG